MMLLPLLVQLLLLQMLLRRAILGFVVRLDGTRCILGVAQALFDSQLSLIHI